MNQRYFPVEFLSFIIIVSESSEFVIIFLLFFIPYFLHLCIIWNIVSLLYSFNSIDSWIYYTKYFDSLFKIIETKDKYLNCNGNTDSIPCFDSSIEEALLFLNELQKLNSEQSYPQRGVYLAYLELYSRLKENANKYMGKIINFIFNLIFSFTLLKNIA